MKSKFIFYGIAPFLLGVMFFLAGCEDVSEESSPAADNIDQTESALAAVEAVEDSLTGGLEVGKETLVQEAGEKNMKVEEDGESLVLETGLGRIEVDETGKNGFIKDDAPVTIETGQPDPSASVPEDLPHLEGAADFSWAGSSNNGMLTYKVSNIKYDEVCSKQEELLKAWGWVADAAVAVQFSGTDTRSYNKEGYVLSLTCMGEDGDGREVSVTMVKGQN